MNAIAFARIMRLLAKECRCYLRRHWFGMLLPFRPTTRPTTTTLIVAPHPDDETFGCGGMIHIKSRLGSEIHVVFLTNGEGSLRAHQGHPCVNSESVAQVRRDQTREACRYLGISDCGLHWLDLKDGAIPGPNQPDFKITVSRITHLVAKYGIEEILAPSPADALPDHEAASKIVSAVLDQADKQIKVTYYLVWGWYNAPWGMGQFDWKRAWRFDISKSLTAKYAAIGCYLDSVEPISGFPYAGKLPKSLINCAMKRDEVFFDA